MTSNVLDNVSLNCNGYDLVLFKRLYETGTPDFQTCNGPSGTSMDSGYGGRGSGRATWAVTSPRNRMVAVCKQGLSLGGFSPNRSCFCVWNMRQVACVGRGSFPSPAGCLGRSCAETVSTCTVSESSRSFTVASVSEQALRGSATCFIHVCPLRSAACATSPLTLRVVTVDTRSQQVGPPWAEPEEAKTECGGGEGPQTPPDAVLVPWRRTGGQHRECIVPRECPGDLGTRGTDVATAA